MLRCLSGHSHKCCDAWPNSSTRSLADVHGHLRLTTDTSSAEQSLHDLSRVGLWASTSCDCNLVVTEAWGMCQMQCMGWLQTDDAPLVFDCPWCRTRNAHPGRGQVSAMWQGMSNQETLQCSYSCEHPDRASRRRCRTYQWRLQRCDGNCRRQTKGNSQGCC